MKKTDLEKKLKECEDALFSIQGILEGTNDKFSFKSDTPYFEEAMKISFLKGYVGEAIKVYTRKEGEKNE